MTLSDMKRSKNKNVQLSLGRISDRFRNMARFPLQNAFILYPVHLTPDMKMLFALHLQNLVRGKLRQMDNYTCKKFFFSVRPTH